MKSRDDFTLKTKILLAERVSHFCSNPDCRVVTKGARFDTKKNIGVGVAAHISAAAIGGPRYDPSLTEEQRKDIKNGIWLCQTCSRLIDVDIEKYSIYFLNSWKKKAESYSNNNVGKKLYDESSFNREVTKRTMEYVLNDDLEHIDNFALEAINLKERDLEKLDPRFKVSTSVINGVVKNTIEPAFEPVILSMGVVDSCDAAKFSDSITRLMTEGKSVKMKASQIIIQDSPLFDKILTKDAEFLMSPHKRKMQCELYAHNLESNVFIGSFNAKMYGGSEKTFIEGNILNQFIIFSSEFSDKSKFTYTINTDSWIGKSIHKLPFFPKLLKCLPILFNGGGLIVEVNDCTLGDIKIADTLKHENSNDFLIKLALLIKYVDMARKIATYLNVDLSYQYFESSQKDIEAMENVYNLLSGSVIVTGDLIEKNPTFKVKLSDDFSLEKSPINKPNVSIRLDETLDLTKILDQKIPLITIRHQYDDVTIISKDSLSENSDVTLELVMNNNSKYIKSLVKI